ncbi:L-cysteate sulfo-lyase [Symmachiella dynata]|uniref:L-cysteate sulfo-lyase n=1 Tax=Symmachiella dynata TaxID=2527995 RepID=A0A517ZL13_9PLAN|nr:D-cysteine desulfhydrase family protein [Symmachiella dynata]QDU43179.1 L-cysteate sulfo-lyase [Symmachiella dynata]
MPRLTTDELRAAVAKLPHFPLAHTPTPLEHLPKLSKLLGGPQIYIKRDDCTGLTFGGNKTRHNELILGDAIKKQADIFVWGAGIHSNNCRQTAAACAKAGIDIHLVLGRGRPANGPDPIQGNLLLDYLVGAKVEIIEGAIGPEVDEHIMHRSREYAAAGRTVYSWDRKVVKPLAAVGYVTAMIEIAEQAAAQSFTPDAVYLCSAGSTGAGLVAGSKALGLNLPITHCAPIVWPWDTRADMARIAREAGELIGVSVDVESSDIDLSEEYIGPTGYGTSSPAGLEAISLMARQEAILLDPIYSSKAMSGLIDHIRQGRFTADQNVVFVHTGGTPALFSLNDEIMQGIGPRAF